MKEVFNAFPDMKHFFHNDYTSSNCYPHEAHFGQVTQNFLKYLGEGGLPEWEAPGMIAKYYTTTQAWKIAGN